jgi:hypothetical protein
MTASAKPDGRHPNAQNEEPAKGGLKPAHEKAYPSGDSPKPHGDKLKHTVDEAAERKKAP